MERFYTALNRFDAYLLLHRLQQAGIVAHIFNEHMSSIAGDVPVDVSQPQVWLDDDADGAVAADVLRAYQEERNRTGTIGCSKCGEDNPATFDLCWKCGWSLQPIDSRG